MSFQSEVTPVPSVPENGPRRAGVGDVASGAHAHGRQAGAGQASPGAAVAAVGPEGPRAPAVVSAAQQPAHLLQRQRHAAGSRLQERHRRRYATYMMIIFQPPANGAERLKMFSNVFSEKTLGQRGQSGRYQRGRTYCPASGAPLFAVHITLLLRFTIIVFVYTQMVVSVMALNRFHLGSTST